MNDILHQEYAKAKDNLNTTQKKALKTIIEKEAQIQKTQNEITKILRENDLNIFDIEKYKHEKNVETFLKTDFSK